MTPSDPAQPGAAALIDALSPLFAPDPGVSADQLTALAGSLDAPDAAPLLAACCRAVAIRSLIVAASQANNAEAARRAAMTLLELFTPPTPDAGRACDDPAAIAHTRALLERAQAPTEPAENPAT